MIYLFRALALELMQKWESKLGKRHIIFSIYELMHQQISGFLNFVLTAIHLTNTNKTVPAVYFFSNIF